MGRGWRAAGAGARPDGSALTGQRLQELALSGMTDVQSPSVVATSATVSVTIVTRCAINSIRRGPALLLAGVVPSLRRRSDGTDAASRAVRKAKAAAAAATWLVGGDAVAVAFTCAEGFVSCLAPIAAFPLQ